MRTPDFLQLHQVDSAQLAAEAAAGLRSRPAALSPKFFYDTLGSRLFEAITALEEYYPTRTEAAILAERGPVMAAAVQARLGRGITLVDLGAGSCAKAARLFEPLAVTRYVAVDISVEFLRDALIDLQRRWPTIELRGVGLDFSQRLALPAGLVEGPALLFYPGSSIGNFSPAEALRLLREARALAAGGALLIGVDLVKPVAELEAAYDDALGVTAAFNLNLLNHVNRVLGSDFRVQDWRHVAYFNAASSRIEMHLEARHALQVRWPGGQRAFEAGERLHTENSCKWTVPDFESLLRQAGFGELQCWTDAAQRFGVFLAS